MNAPGPGRTGAGTGARTGADRPTSAAVSAAAAATPVVIQSSEGVYGTLAAAAAAPAPTRAAEAAAVPLPVGVAAPEPVRPSQERRVVVECDHHVPVRLCRSRVQRFPLERGPDRDWDSSESEQEPEQEPEPAAAAAAPREGRWRRTLRSLMSRCRAGRASSVTPPAPPPAVASAATGVASATPGVTAPAAESRLLVSHFTELGRDGSLVQRTVHTTVDFVHRLVPDLLRIVNSPFYWGEMDRFEAERLLDNKPEGTFLLRDSAQEEYLFSVSFRRYGRSLHARVEQWERRFSFDAHDPAVFAAATVTALIEHYKDAGRCMFFEPLLTRPLPRSFVFPLSHLCRATIVDCVGYDDIARLRLPRVLRMFLKEYHYRQPVRVRRFELPEEGGDASERAAVAVPVAAAAICERHLPAPPRQ